MKYPSECVEKNERSMKGEEKTIKELVPPHYPEFTIKAQPQISGNLK